jgi:hypothetical protein
MVRIRFQAKYKHFVFLIPHMILFSCQLSFSNRLGSKVFDYGGLEEFHERGGLPNFFGKIKTGQEVRVAYIGGSITEARDGWRDLTFSWMRSNYPLAPFKQFDAAIGGTGSDLGVFRMEKDVIRHKPDLIFVEFAVNDFGLDTESVYKTMEGIVRKTWRNNPYADICFVYTVAENVVETILNGNYQNSALAMEKIAEHYQIPSLHLGVEVVRLLKAGRLVFTGNPEDHPGKIVFTKDKTHPLSLTGHPVYAHAVISFLKRIEENDQPKRHFLVKPYIKDNWENAKMIPLAELDLNAGWEELSSADELSRKFSKFMPALYKAKPPTASFTVRFEGSTLGVYDVVGPKTGIIELLVDGQKPKKVYRFDQWCNYSRIHSFFVDSLADGKHEITFIVSGKKFDKGAILGKKGVIVTNPAEYEEYGWFANSLLLVGDLIK